MFTFLLWCILVRSLLASRPSGPDRVSVHLAHIATVPHRRRRSPRGPGGDLPRHHAAFPPAGSPIPHLSWWKSGP